MTSFNKRKMAPEMGFGAEAGPPKKEQLSTSKFFPHGRPASPFVSNTTSASAESATQWFPHVSTSPLSSNPSTISSTPPTWSHDGWQAPDSKAFESRHRHLLQETLTEAHKRAAVAERKAAEHLQAKADAELQLRNHIIASNRLSSSNQGLTAEIRTLKEALNRQAKRTKACEKATTKAQTEAKNAKGHAEHTINSQKGQLKNAERRFTEASRELKEWRDKYGLAVENPAEEIAALQAKLSEWQSGAQKGRDEVTAFKGQGLQELGQDATDADKASQGSSKTYGGEQDSAGNGGSQTSIENEKDPSSVAAEAQAAKYKEERDELQRMLRDEMARNVKLAESLVLRNAKLEELFESWAMNGGES